MAVQINLSQTQKEQPMGRRLFSIAAPLVGEYYGGPAGAAAGKAIAAKVNGGTTEAAVTDAGKTAISGALGKSPATPGEASLGDSSLGAYQRKLDLLKQNPQNSINEGLDVLSRLPNEHPLRQELAEPLIRAQMLAEQNGNRSI